RLAKLLTCDTRCASANLHVGDGRQLMRLDMRPQSHPEFIATGLYPRDVAVHRIKVDRQGGSVEFLDAHGSKILGKKAGRSQDRGAPLDLPHESTYSPGTRRAGRVSPIPKG